MSKQAELFMKSLTFFILLSFTIICFAETIYLKDGSIIKGKIVSQDANMMTVHTDMGEITIKKDNISKIVFDETVTSVETPKKEVIQNNEIKSSPNYKEMEDYASWRKKLDGARDRKTWGYIGIVSGVCICSLAFIAPSKNEFGGTTPSYFYIVCGGIGAACGLIAVLGGSNSIRDLEEIGRQKGYTVTFNFFPYINSIFGKKNNTTFGLAASLSF